MIEEKYLVYLWINLSQLNPMPGKSDSVSFQLHFSPYSFVECMSRVLQWHFSLNIISLHFNFPTKTSLPDQDTDADLYYAMPDVYKKFFYESKICFILSWNISGAM